MVDKIPTTVVQIMSQSDIMKSGQNYKINKKIWELIEQNNNSQSGEGNSQGNEGGEDNPQTDNENIDFSFDDVKEKMGYINIPEGESLMSQIISLKNQIINQYPTQQEPEE